MIAKRWKEYAVSARRRAYFSRLAATALIAGLAHVWAGVARAEPTVDPELAARLAVADPGDQFGVLLTFHGDRVTETDVQALEGLGITMGVRMVNLPIVGVNASRAQIEQLQGWGSLRSIYRNAPLDLTLHQTKPLIQVDRLRKDAALTSRNGGLPVSGRGITIAINDSGIDGTHADLTFDLLDPASDKTIQNVLVNMSDKDGLIVRLDSLGNPLVGILPPVFVEDVIDTDTHIGHGTHVASIAAGTGEASGGLYQGVAPGARLVGLGSGLGLFVLGQVASFDWIFSNQFLYNIRVVNNSWGNSAVTPDPDHPVNVATRRLHDEAHIAVVFANGNDGPIPNSQNRFASLPWTINVGAATKQGRLVGFSSRGIFGDPVIHPTVIAPGSGGPTAQGFTSRVVAARARVNAVANGGTSDVQIPPAFVANYTQAQGTSMAAPHAAGVVANVLEAAPSLLPDQVRSILERTATVLAVYDRFEVGAGLVNVHAAVDLAFNPGKAYGDFGFTGKGLALQAAPPQGFAGTLVPGGSDTHAFAVPASSRFTFVQLDWDGAIGEEELVADNTNIVLHDLALTIRRDGQVVASSDALNLAALFGAREAVKLEFPAAGSYTAEVSSGTFDVLVDQPYRLSVSHFQFDPAQVGDIAHLDAATRLATLRLIYDRVLFAAGGAFRPGDILLRGELARALMFGARVPQFLPDGASFTDVTTGPDRLVVESLRREGIMGLDGPVFGPAAQVSRLEQAVALVRALRQEQAAAALAGTEVTSGGQPLVDNGAIPDAFRGHVQIALDQGLMEAFPAEVRQIKPGQFEVIPGPRFEPGRLVQRLETVAPLTRLLGLLFGE